MTSLRPDVLVVGGGIIGMSVAYELARSGRAVAIIDRHRLDGGCAWGSAGHLVPSHVAPLAGRGALRDAVVETLRPNGAVTVALAPTPAALGWLARFAWSARARNVEGALPAMSALACSSDELWTEWLARLGLPVPAGPGLLDAYGDAAAFDRARHHAEQLRRNGVAVDVLDGPSVRCLEPSLNQAAVGGLLFRSDRNVHPGQLIEAMTGALSSLGVDLLPHAALLGVEAVHNRVERVHTERGPIRAAEVVVATGAYTAEVARRLGVRVPMLPGRGHSITVARPQQGPRLPMLLGERHVAISPMVGPAGEELRVSGRFELGRFGLTPNHAKTERLVRLARSLVDLDEQLVVHRRWAGLRPVTPDGVPVIGRPGRWRNVTIAAGHAMVGLSFAPGTAALVRDLLDGKPSVRRFSPDRFRRYRLR